MNPPVWNHTRTGAGVDKELFTQIFSRRQSSFPTMAPVGCTDGQFGGGVVAGRTAGAHGAHVRDAGVHPHADRHPRAARVGVPGGAQNLLPGFDGHARMLLAGDAMSQVHRGPGAFYAVIPHGVMAWTGTITFGWAVLAIALGVARYWRACGGGRVAPALVPAKPV